MCDFGQKVRNGFDEVADMLYQLDWHELPLEMQKNMPMVLAVAQKNIYIGRFGSNITYSRPVFKKVTTDVFIMFNYFFFNDNENAQI